MSPAEASPIDDAAARAKHERLRRQQIRLNFRSVFRNSNSLPVWATLFNFMFAGAVPEIADTPWSVSWIWLAVCAAVAAGGFVLHRLFRAADRDGAFDVDRWYACVMALHLGIGISWSTAIWIHWDPSNPTNHVFLFVMTVSCAALYAVVRSGDFNVVLMGTAPLFATLWLHFLQQSLWLDTFLAIILPLWVLQFLLDSRSGCAAILSAHTAKIELEAAAEDLALARDDAQKQREAAVRASASKSHFLANMSHELRTPLNAILGFSEIIGAQSLGPAPAAQDRYRSYARDIHASGRHLLSLINDILDIAKIEAGKLKLDAEWLDGEALLADALKLVHDRAAAKNVALHMKAEPQIRVFADQRALKQIALNLLSNAVKFTECGSVTASLLRDADAALLIVEDTGVGIPSDQVDRIFEPFEQVDNRYARPAGGTGLGLTLVRALTELHGGACRIVSQEGKGTRVEVRLPHAISGDGSTVRSDGKEKSSVLAA
jgi:two-component system, cell cycle sensor histidine kinase PleC